MDRFRARLLPAVCLTLLLGGPADGQPGEATNVLTRRSVFRVRSAPQPVAAPPVLSQAETRSFQGHQNTVHALAFTPNGKFLVSAGHDNTIRLWGLASGQELRCLTGHQNPITSIALAPDGKTLASASLDRTLRLWDLASGRELRQFTGHEREVQAVAFSPNGKFLASAGLDRTVRLWGLASGQELRRFVGHQGQVDGVAFSPDGKLLASGGQDHTVRLWDVASGKELRQPGGFRDAVTAVAFSPDGKTLAAGSRDQTLRLFDVDTGNTRAHLAGHQGVVCALAFSPDGKTLASAAADRTARLWEVATGRARGLVYERTNSVWAVAFSPDGRSLATASDDRIARLWDVTGSSPQQAAATSPQELDPLWADLAGQDAARAYQALWKLVASRDAVPFLRARLLQRGQAGPLDPRRLAQRIADLDDDRPEVREQASEELEKLGTAAEPALREALAGRHSAEVDFRVRLLLEHLQGSIWSPETLRRLRSVEVLEYLATPEARQLLEALADQASEPGLSQEARAAAARCRRSGG